VHPMVASALVVLAIVVEHLSHGLASQVSVSEIWRRPSKTICDKWVRNMRMSKGSLTDSRRLKRYPEARGHAAGPISYYFISGQGNGLSGDVLFRVRR
jgi:hypothetical protein